MLDDSLSELIAASLIKLHVRVLFGVVGIPVTEIAEACISKGIQFIGFRNEQSASYAAAAYGFLTATPGVCLTVSGPGMIHALAGISNAWSNCWPLIVISGSSDSRSRGGFQECPQVEAAAMFVKRSFQIEQAVDVPDLLQRAYNVAISSRPGPVYIDLPGDVISMKCDASSVAALSHMKLPVIPKSMADPKDLVKAADLLKKAKRPLIIVGKGAAYGKAEMAIRKLVEKSNFPFLATPMAKGVVSDSDPHCVSAARSFALQHADCILLLGARLNWMLHFGQPPRFSKDVCVIQVDICAEEMTANTNSLVGDCSLIVEGLNEKLEGYSFPSQNEWWNRLKLKCSQNNQIVRKMMDSTESPMDYYSAYKIITLFVKQDDFISAEGANTMDIGRTLLLNSLPRHRLDAGTFGTISFFQFCFP